LFAAAARLPERVIRGQTFDAPPPPHVLKTPSKNDFSFRGAFLSKISKPKARIHLCRTTAPN
jgi:hypothetical protein